ncbi:hypothetical protein J056_004280 [Wallemia ichthyophaga EXF-994]|uniref:Oxidoreductase AflY n=1 Tax=Wallemia ichthyophaga (strain EXF-994 / CBS 113033) TaxID=1299270 RepID=R9AGY8_WALI9|nr:uncharacterized protein J056_004280 [Wallemia ichthyophaga EXF-994]EOR01494.1 hypothetical protein J056_004280 [Wallemia ichthyophaga EXF-994]TIA73208.1 hypothetical protein E3P91_01585 [Wallemia ichthyophaga]TIB63809.1 hypothetical protein E3P78_01606 [Wallemia ichthyophaga]
MTSSINTLLRSNLWPGTTTTSKKLAQTLVNTDISKNDAYFNEMGFHNHFTHVVFAAYAMGAQPHALNRVAAAASGYQKPIRPAEKGTRITHDNWNNVELLGNRDNYTTYLSYFREAVKDSDNKDIATLLEKYLYSREANDGGVSMLSRLFSGLIHPIIHLGYALEFEHLDNKREVLAQAFAWTATHNSDYNNVLPADLWNEPEKPNAQRKTALQVLLDVLKNEDLSPSSPHTPVREDNSALSTTNKLAGGIIAEEAANFDLPATEIPGKEHDIIRELAFAALFMYANGCYKARKQFKPEFILVHILNSSHFIPYVLSHTPDPRNKRLFVAAYLRATLLVYVARGRPSVPNSRVINNRPLPEDVSNIWLQVVDDALKQNDEHVTKAVRTLAFYGCNFCQYTPPELLTLGFDDTIWSRVAQQLIAAFNQGSQWSYEKPGFDQSWEGDRDVYTNE